MKIRTRLFLVFLILVGLGFYQFVNVIVEDLRPRYLATMEESMVETATLLSSLVSSQLEGDTLPTEDLAAMIDLAGHWNIAARIFEMDKTGMSLRVYVTDAAGVVVYDSDGGRDVGKDYSQWNDVYLTLRGKYGARATRSDPDDGTTSVLHVAAPIMRGEQIIGVLTVAKPARSVEPFRQTAKERIVHYGVVVAVLIIVLGTLISLWITWPIETLTSYANAIRDGKRPEPPRMGRSEMGRLATSFEEMRDALEGKKYVEKYVETLTHEMKSPLSAIRGAAELMEEDMPTEQRERFLQNIREETTRMHTLVERLLQLSELESRKELQREPVNMAELVRKSIESMTATATLKQVQLSSRIDEVPALRGERFLLEQAVANLLQNAIDFTAEGKSIRLTLAADEGQVRFRVENAGDPIPDFALERIFERFYSLPRPDSGRKSSGIGLTLVQEVAALHGGSVRIENRDEGVVATLILPL